MIILATSAAYAKRKEIFLSNYEVIVNMQWFAYHFWIPDTLQ